LTGNYVSSGWNSIDIDESSDYVFLLSEYEIAGTTTFSVGGEGEYYAYYKDYANTAALRHKVTKTGATDSFWTRSPRFSNTVCTFYLGNQNTNYASDKSARVSFGFCV